MDFSDACRVCLKFIKCNRTSLESYTNVSEIEIESPSKFPSNSEQNVEHSNQVQIIAMLNYISGDVYVCFQSFNQNLFL